MANLNFTAFVAFLVHSGMKMTDREEEKVLNFMEIYKVSNFETCWGYLCGLRDGMNLGLQSHTADLVKVVEELQTEVKNLKEQVSMSLKLKTDLITISHNFRATGNPSKVIPPTIPKSVNVIRDGELTLEAAMKTMRLVDKDLNRYVDVEDLKKFLWDACQSVNVDTWNYLAANPKSVPVFRDGVIANMKNRMASNNTR